MIKPAGLDLASYSTSSYSRSTRRTALEDSAIPRTHDNDTSSRYSSSLVSRAPSVGRFNRSASVDPSAAASSSSYEYTSSVGRKSSIDYSRANDTGFSRSTSIDYSAPKGSFLIKKIISFFLCFHLVGSILSFT